MGIILGTYPCTRVKGRHMTIDLTPDQQELVREYMRLGNYATEQAVVDDALGRLMEDVVIAGRDRGELKASLQRGRAELDRGEGLVLCGDEGLAAYFDGVIKRGKARHAARAKAMQE
jgi:hypothetical protein